MTRPLNPDHIPSDYGIAHAIQVIRSTYGVETWVKPKQLIKFGRYASLGTSRQTVQTQGGSETLLTDNLITHISSANAGDTQTIGYEGQTIDADGNLSFFTDTVTLQGQTKVALPTPCARATRAYNAGSVNLAGDVYLYEDDTLTNGVPDTASKLHLQVPAQANQSEKCATAFSANDYWIIVGAVCNVLKKTTAVCDFVLQIKSLGGVWRDQIYLPQNRPINFTMPIIIPSNSDVRVVASASTTNVEVTAAIGGFLAIKRGANGG